MISDPAGHLGYDWPPLIEQADQGSRDGIPWSKFDFDDSKWRTMKLPAFFEKSLPDHDGVVWFRKTVNIPAEIAKQQVSIMLGPIDDMDKTWVNGISVGGYETPGSHTVNRHYTVMRGVLRPGKNVVAVRVMDHHLQGGFAGKVGQMMFRTRTGEKIRLDGDWKFHAGADIETLRKAHRDQPKITRRNPGPFTEGFQLGENPVIALTGSTTTVKQSENGYLETLLHQLPGKQTVQVRNLAWQADTVYQQQRPLNFGSHIDTLNRTDATIIIAHFGQMESLEGREKLPDFLAAYGKLLDEYETKTKQIALVTPHPFEKPASNLLPDLSKRNKGVAAYAGAIRELAKKRGYLCIDLSDYDTSGQTKDGIHFTDTGHWKLAFEMVEQLTGSNPISGDALKEDGTFANAKLEELRQAIVKKNFLWHQHWRPTNWAFAYGDRQHVAASHDHRPGKPRWMPKEIDQIIQLIEVAEGEIAKKKGALK